MTASEPLLRVEGLAVRYHRGHRRLPPAVSDVDIAVGEGETVALVGESGSGKSTVGNAVLGLVPPAEGRIVFAGEDVTHAPASRRRALTKDIQAIFQDPYGSLNPVRTIGQTLVEPLRAHRGRARDERARVAEALARVGLPADAADRYPGQFSGGQRQRVAIARALIVGPRLVVCDEPTSSLDLSIQAQVLNLLLDLQRAEGLGYLFITHDLAVVRHIAHRVVVLYRGRVVESGPTSQVCDHPQQPYTQALLAAVPDPDPVEQRARRRAYRGVSVRVGTPTFPS
ncbi:ATP-binding cassette domain-containing protein [Actinophytocola sp.]|jgi:peptide/nickel transport system ATP-binding protein|uniref:ATP-binding cassette domain-containing protein n=1 Tax=Actinophytocola sp. TaxID=1872138 RepID=UPI002ED9C742